MYSDKMRSPAGWPSRYRLLLVLLAVMAVVSPLAVASSAQVNASKVSLSVSRSVAAPAELVVMSGVVSPAAAGRTVWLQRHGKSWVTAVSAVTTSTGYFYATVRAGAAGSKTSWRALARPTKTAAQAISVTMVLSVVTQTLTLSAPTSVDVGRAFTLTGSGSPARPGRVVVIQRLSGKSWVEAGRWSESSTGGYARSINAGGVSTTSYRAVALSLYGAAAVVSPTRVVAVKAPKVIPGNPEISLSPTSTSADYEKVTISGKLPGFGSRKVHFNRTSNLNLDPGGWPPLAETTTTSTGAYSVSFNVWLSYGPHYIQAMVYPDYIGGKTLPAHVTAPTLLTVVRPSLT